MTKLEQQKEWENRINLYRASGRSVTQWCAANNVRPGQLWYWLRKFKSGNDAALIPSNQWLPVEVRHHSPGDNPLLIRVGEACIQVKPGFDPALLTQVVRTLLTLC
jgi:hypothetical protein